MQLYRCGCGEWTGDPCGWRGPAQDMVVVEYMPKLMRAKHEEAGTSGCYPYNGAVRISAHLSCAQRLIEDTADSRWAEIISNSEEIVDRYALKADDTD